MISAFWIVIALIVGVMFGIFIIAITNANNDK